MVWLVRGSVRRRGGGVKRGRLRGMAAPVLVLLHSPLVGPATLAPLASALRKLGHVVTVPRMHEAGFEGTPAWASWVDSAFEQVAALWAGPIVLVGHSGAGPLLPVLADRLGERVAGLVFLDAGLPPAEGAVPLGPADFVRFLDGLEIDGELPPWSAWWGTDTLRELIPDAALLAAVEAELPRLPVSYFDASVEVAAGWDERLPPAYVRLSAAYDEDAARARERGFPVGVFEGAHLDTVSRPGEVAEVVDRVVRELVGE